MVDFIVIMLTGIGRVSCVTYREAESQKSQAISHL